jgi:hypothetical protein
LRRTIIGKASRIDPLERYFWTESRGSRVQDSRFLHEKLGFGLLPKNWERMLDNLKRLF